MMLAMVVLYAPWMGRGYVNLEYPFSMAARALSDSRYAGQIETYFAVQANPLGYSFVLAIIYKIFGYHDWFWLAKLPSLCGALMILISGWILTRDRWQSRRSLFYFWSSLVILHPMILAFGTAATADVLPVGLLMLAIAIAFKSTDDALTPKFMAALVFGLAIIVKYNSAYFGCAFLYAAIVGENFVKRAVQQTLRDVLVFVLVPFGILASYVWWTYDRYGVFISNRLVKHRPNFFDFSSWLWTSNKYLVFLGFFGGPISLCVVLKTTNLISKKLKTLLFLSCAFCGWFVISLRNDGEMDFGRGINENQFYIRTLEATGMVFGLCLLLILLRRFVKRDRLDILLFCGLVPYLFLISFSLPIQRYLIFAIPIVLLLLVDASNVLNAKLRNVTMGLTALGFAAVSLLGMSYLRAQGNASENMAVWMEQNLVIDQSSAAPIGVHAGQHFYGITSSEIKYEVIQTSLKGEKLIKERILHREAMNVLGKITRVYVLRELPKVP
jgi:hypothetical protein